MIDQFKLIESGLEAFAEAERRDALAAVRKLCEERIVEVDQPTARAFDGGTVWMARQVLDLLDKEEGLSDPIAWMRTATDEIAILRKALERIEGHDISEMGHALDMQRIARDALKQADGGKEAT